MRYLRFVVLGLLPLAVLALVTLPRDGPSAEAIPGWPDSTPGVIDTISIDGYTTGNSPNGPINPVMRCVDVQLGGTATFDIVVDEVDPADLITGFEIELWYTHFGPGGITITGVDTAGQMIAANPGSVHVAGSDPVPDEDGVFKIAADDVGPVPSSAEQGEGVLATIEITGGPIPGLSPLVFGDANTAVFDQNGAPIPVSNFYDAIVELGTGGCSYIDVAIMQETISGPAEIGSGGGDYLIENTVRNDSTGPFDAEVTTEIVPPAECDAGSGLGNPHTIVTDLPAMPVGVDTDVDLPFNVQCPLGGVYDSDFLVSSEIDIVTPNVPPDFYPYNDAVHHDQSPGAPPPLTLTPFESPGPALRLHVMNCPSEPPWPAPPGDSDCDGFTDGEEAFVATDAADACPDDLDDDAWPADMAAAEGYGKHDGTVNILDVVQLTPPYFNVSPPDPNYSVRKDFNGDGVIDILDIVRLTPPTFNQTCG